MRLALCNEVLDPMPFDRQCAFAAALGYAALEIAPYTLAGPGHEPHALPGPVVQSARAALAAAGIACSGLHWLLVRPDGLSITSADAKVRARTLDVMRGLVDLAAELGARYLVHGSPKQRLISPGDTREAALARATELWARAGEHAASAGLVYCIEPLSADQTPLVNTVAEAAAIVDAVGSPGLRTMLDTSSAAQAEIEPLPALLERHLASGHVAHVQLNDRNRRGPGQGQDRFAGVLATLTGRGYAGAVAIEPFDYAPDGPACAARAIGYVQGLLEALEDAGQPGAPL
jgi:sugar phosphate isomerase/epimerase